MDRTRRRILKWLASFKGKSFRKNGKDTGEQNAENLTNNPAKVDVVAANTAENNESSSSPPKGAPNLNQKARIPPTRKRRRGKAIALGGYIPLKPYELEIIYGLGPDDDMALSWLSTAATATASITTIATEQQQFSSPSPPPPPPKQQHIPLKPYELEIIYGLGPDHDMALSWSSTAATATASTTTIASEQQQFSSPSPPPPPPKQQPSPPSASTLIISNHKKTVTKKQPTASTTGAYSSPNVLPAAPQQREIPQQSLPIDDARNTAAAAKTTKQNETGGDRNDYLLLNKQGKVHDEDDNSSIGSDTAGSSLSLGGLSLQASMRLSLATARAVNKLRKRAASHMLKQRLKEHNQKKKQEWLEQQQQLEEEEEGGEDVSTSHNNLDNLSVRRIIRTKEQEEAERKQKEEALLRDNGAALKKKFRYRKGHTTPKQIQKSFVWELKTKLNEMKRRLKRVPKRMKNDSSNWVNPDHPFLKELQEIQAKVLPLWRQDTYDYWI